MVCPLMNKFMVLSFCGGLFLMLIVYTSRDELSQESLSQSDEQDDRLPPIPNELRALLPPFIVKIYEAQRYSEWTSLYESMNDPDVRAKFQPGDETAFLAELAKYPGLLEGTVLYVVHITKLTEQSEEAKRFIDKIRDELSTLFTTQARIFTEKAGGQLDYWGSMFAVSRAGCDTAKRLLSHCAKLSDAAKVELKTVFGINDKLWDDPTVKWLKSEFDRACDANRNDQLLTLARKYAHLL